MNQNLYQISNEYQRLLNLDEYTSADLDKLNMLDQDMKSRAVQIAAHILNKKAELLAVQGAIDAMQDRSDKLFDKILYLNNYLKEQMLKCNLHEVTDHAEFEIKVKNNPPKVQVLDQTIVPVEYMVKKEIVSIDKNLLKEAINKGVNVPGVKLIQDTRLEIK